MSWEFEKVFTDTGVELSTGALNTTLGQTQQLAYDGRFLWVTAANGVGIYEFWGESSGNEPSVDEVNDLTWNRYLEEGPLRKLKLITFIRITSSTVSRSTRYKQLSPVPGWVGAGGSVSVGGKAVTVTQKRPDLQIFTEVYTNTSGVALTPYWIAKLGDRMYVSSGINFSRIFVFDISTQALVGEFTLGNEPDNTPVLANSNLLASNGKLWFVNRRFTDSEPQKLFNYRVSDGTIGSVNINVRPSFTRTWLADGFNGFIYVTNHNGVSVTRYSSETGAFGARIRTNAFPTRIFTDQNRRIFVGSFSGMLTLVDWDDDSVHNDYSTLNETQPVAGFTSDPVQTEKVWFVTDGTKLVRYDLNTKQQYETFGQDDWSIINSGISTPGALLAIPERTYLDSDGNTVTQRPYLIILDGAAVKLIAIDNYLVRKNFFEVYGQGAVVAGAQQYFGEGP